MYRIKAVSYQGPYESNEDAVCFNDGEKIKGVVCDGVGSYANASKAAQYAAEYLCKENNEELPARICECHTELRNHERFGFTTVAAIEQIEENRFLCCNVGDTRIYCVGYQVYTQISKDHTNQKRLEKVYEKFYDSSEATKMARHFSVLEAALGHKLDIDTSEYTLEDSELLLIASDGAWEPLEEEFHRISQYKKPCERADALLESLELFNTNEKLKDNATLLILWRE